MFFVLGVLHQPSSAIVRLSFSTYIIQNLMTTCIQIQNVKMFVHIRAHTWGQRDTHIFVHSMRRSSLSLLEDSPTISSIATIVVDGRISETSNCLLFILSHSSCSLHG